MTDISSPLPENMPDTLDYPQVGADALLAGAARAYPDRIALRDGEQTLTYAEVNDHARRVANGLRDRGIEPGDAIAVHLPNSMWFIVAYYGILCAGAAIAPINPAQPSNAVRQQLDECEASAVVTHPTGAATVTEAAGAATSVRFAVCVPPSHASPLPTGVTAPTGLVALADLLAAEPLTGYRVDPELVAHLQFTGGTTGRSKAVRVLHRNLVANVTQVAASRAACLPSLDAEGCLRFSPVPGAVTRYHLRPGEGSQLAVAPLFHGLGLVGHNVATALGSTVVVTGRFHPDTFLADIERREVNSITGSPAMYYAILRSAVINAHDLSSVRLITSGAAPIDTTALQQLRDTFPNASVIEGYGLSEATMGASGGPIELASEIPVGSVGLPLLDTEIQIRATDRATVLPPGTTGDVWVHGPQVTDGYLGHPDLTAEQFVDGWLCTGDLGCLDEHGYLFLVGRAKDMLIYKGYNVYPQPLEELLCSHPSVAQAAVVGQPRADVGELPVGFVVLRPGVSSPGTDFLDEVMDHVADQVAPYQRVRGLHVVDALPTTPTGKVLKTELRTRLEADASDLGHSFTP